MNEMTLRIPLGHLAHMKLVMALFPWSLCCSLVSSKNSFSLCLQVNLHGVCQTLLSLILYLENNHLTEMLSIFNPPLIRV